MGMFRHLNLKPEDWTKQFIQLFKDQADLYSRIRVRCMAVLTENLPSAEKGLWWNGLTLVHLWPSGNLPPERPPYRYPEVHLLEEWFGLDALPQIITQIYVTHKLALQGEEVQLDPTASLIHSQFQPRQTTYSPLSGWLFDPGVAHRPSIPSEPLLAPRLPFYADGLHAMQDWFELPELTWNDARIGGELLFFPECRAGIKSIGLTEKDHVEIQPRFGQDRYKPGMELKGVWVVGETRQSFEVPFESNVELEIPEGTTGFAVYMVGADGTIYDFHDEMGPWIQGGPRILGGLPTGAAGEIIERALRTGECDVAEYKPYIEMGNTKQEEIVESVIAFANTKGGSILFGIDKHSAVIGIEQELYRLTRANGESFESTVEKYKGWLRRLIGDTLNRGIVPQFHFVEIEGHKVLALVIPEGREKPYGRVRSNDIWVRKGSNNVRPDPDTDLPELLESPDSTTSYSGTTRAIRRRWRLG